jgi:hypothetical protein
MNLDFKEHMHLFHNTEIIAYTRVTNTGNYSTTITTAYKTGLDRHEKEASGGVYTHFDCGWQFPSDSLVDDPKPGDEITDLHFTYKVLSVQRPMFNGFWGLRCTRLNIEEDLKDIITIYRQVPSTTDDWADKILDPVPYPDGVEITARVQPDISQTNDILGKRGFTENYVIWTFLQTEPEFGDYVEIKGEVPQWKYKVVGWNDRKSLTELLKLNTIIIP